MNTFSIHRFQVINNHPYMRALADVEFNKLMLRGLKLEDRGRGDLTLGFPGRKVQGHWQVVYETHDRSFHSELLQCLKNHYQNSQGVAA
jgi:hypothetical protein